MGCDNVTVFHLLRTESYAKLLWKSWGSKHCEMYRLFDGYRSFNEYFSQKTWLVKAIQYEYIT